MRGAEGVALVRPARVGHRGAWHVTRCLTRRAASLLRLRPVPTIVVPYRGDAKRRLSPSVRAAAAIAMLGDVVEAASGVGGVIVVTDDVDVVPAAATLVADPGGGLGAAVAAGLVAVKGHALVVNADLPCATPDAIARLAACELALVEASDGTTN